MNKDRYSSHTASRLTVHLVWVTKHRFHVLRGEVQVRCKDLIVRILKGVVSKDHGHMHVEYPPALSVSNLMKRVKGRTSRLLQQEFPHLEKRYWGKHFW